MNVNDETAQAAAKNVRSRRGSPILELFEELLKDGLREGRHVVVDRANCEPFQRQNWLKRACRKEGVVDAMVAVVVLNTPLGVCIERVKAREDHFISEKNLKVVEQWHAALHANYPACKEGFGGVFSIKSDSKRQAFLDVMTLR
eukprot:TRINITY_DN2890_c0_g1_i1.p1 TRINITY_DN2890_c0_g1~~TRINITY_DN2890_c0_g1_i1.p1  ORF type:complete len:144 (+),score=45.15 TRINITY_DN2890_c0_g1_i1:282-713(+)